MSIFMASVSAFKHILYNYLLRRTIITAIIAMINTATPINTQDHQGNTAFEAVVVDTVDVVVLVVSVVVETGFVVVEDVGVVVLVVIGVVVDVVLVVVV